MLFPPVEYLLSQVAIASSSEALFSIPISAILSLVTLTSYNLLSDSFWKNFNKLTLTY